MGLTVSRFAARPRILRWRETPPMTLRPTSASGRLPVALVLVAALTVPVGAAAWLSPEAVAGWTSYITATDQRIAREFGSRDRFLAQDFRPDARTNRAAVLAGRIVIDPMVTMDARGGEMEVPYAMVHHWRGAVLIPGVRLDDLLKQLQSGVLDAKPQEDVLQSRVLERGPDRMRVFLRVQRTKFVTVVYNTEHLVLFKRQGPTRASSASTATRIAEVESPGTPAERELPVGNDRGFLWRWNAYWRYEQVPGGVIAECESVSLSRGIPAVVRYLVSSLIASTAYESMERTLATLRGRFQQR